MIGRGRQRSRRGGAGGRWASLAACAAILALAAPARAADPGIVLRDGLRGALPRGAFGRSGAPDPVLARIIVGRWMPPAEGDPLDGAGDARWEAVRAGPDGAFPARGFGGGYLDVPVDSPSARTVILDAASDALVYVNGLPRAGDVYGTGWMRLPVALHAGRNDLLFVGGRGPIHARLDPPDADAMLDVRDTTLPDLVVGDRTASWAAAVVLNATGREMPRLAIRVSGPGLRATSTAIPSVAPLTTRKAGFRIAGPAPRAPGDMKARLDLVDRSTGRALSHAEITLRVRRPTETRKITFVSEIDGSVQYYALNPARAPRPAGGRALFLSLHGAGVEAIGQADAYEAKAWGDLVCPTNRRPYGFDWEEWGRLDAMEVLDRARELLRPDESRIYLTGHSMGGHGTWQVGVTYADRFGAIGPSAGWVSLGSYGRQAVAAPHASPVEALIERALGPSDTLALSPNLASLGVYILHGTADDNVPIAQAETMAAKLAEFHHDFVFYKQPGAGHWWDASPEPGADCVDWAPMFDFFGRHARPEEAGVREVDFRTASPEVSAWSHWAGILRQIHPLSLSSVTVRLDPGLRRFSGATSNVAALALRTGGLPPDAPLGVDLDGTKIDAIPWPADGTLRLARGAGGWAVAGLPDPAAKGPARYGPFRSVFRHRPLLVYGTRGTPEENAWAFNKARLDSESFRYRGNASFDLVADVAFDPRAEPDRSVVLYGSADTNAAWPALLSSSPIQVRRGAIDAGGRALRNGDFACLFIRPRPGSPVALVGAVSGSGMTGFRVTDRLPYFASAGALPDWVVLGPEGLADTPAGVQAAGYFGMDWGLDTGDRAER